MLTIIKLQFLTPLRVGKKSTPAVDHTDDMILSDTLFSALSHECQAEEIEQFVSWMKKGDILFSNAYPYVGNTLLIQKPLIQTTTITRDEGFDFDFKSLKKLRYIAIEDLKNIYQKPSLQVILKNQDYNRRIGKENQRISVRLSHEEDSLPFSVAAYHFYEESGLYVMVQTKTQEHRDWMIHKLTQLGLTGVGGRKSAGFGKFQIASIIEGENALKSIAPLTLDKNAVNILLSLGLPSAEDMMNLRNGTYKVRKRSGFVYSTTHAESLQRKKDLYVIDSGSSFAQPFQGCIVDVGQGGKHPVYRNQIAFWGGVDL